MDNSNFVDILGGLILSDNEVRKKAEEQYEGIDGKSKLICLTEVALAEKASNELRLMAAVLLRKLLNSSFDESFTGLPTHMKDGIKSACLTSVVSESIDSSMRRKIGDVIAELARNLIDDDGHLDWQQLLQSMFEWAGSESVSMCEASLGIFGQFPGVFGNKQTQYVPYVKKMLLKCLHHSSFPVRALATKGTCNYLVVNDGDRGLIRDYEEVMPLLLSVVGESIGYSEDETCLKALVEMVEVLPKLFKSQVCVSIELFLSIAVKEELENSTRQLGLEGFVSFSESAPGTVRKFPQYIPRAVGICFAMMADLDDDVAEWSADDDAEDEDVMNNSVAGETALDRISCALGGKAVLPCLVATIHSAISSSDWKLRHALLMSVSATAEGCNKQMESTLDDIVGLVVGFLKDEHARVRYAACNALGQLATDFATGFQRSYHELVLPALLATLDDAGNPRIQAHAGAALVNFTEDCPKSVLRPYLDLLMQKLYRILGVNVQQFATNGKKLVLEQIVTTIASVADSAEDHFLTYYDQFMPGLKFIMANLVDKPLRLLRGKTIECISLIGLAVGKEKFLPDAADIMNLLLKYQTEMSATSEYDDDDPQVPYLISAWARMCKILGKDFQPYLAHVMPQLMKVASHKPEVAMVDDEDESLLKEEQGGWQFITMGDAQSFAIKTAGLEDKATACQMLVCYSKELKETFVDYVEPTVKLMVPLLKFYFHDGVRSASAECLPLLLECAAPKGVEFISAMWLYIFPELISAVSGEPESDVLGELLASLAKCIEVTGTQFRMFLDNAKIMELLTIVSERLEEHVNKSEERKDKRKEDDYDEEVEATLVDEDDEDVFILSKIADVLHSLFLVHKEAFLPYWEQIQLHFQKLLEAGRLWPDYQWAMCVWDDVIEFTGPASYAYAGAFLRPMIEGVANPQMEVRQACAYGCGVMAQFGGAPYLGHCDEALGNLVAAINEDDAKSFSKLLATENCISAVVKILKFGNRATSESVDALLSWLPLTEDKEEIVHVYGYICDLVESNSPLILGDNNSKLPAVVGCVASCLAEEATVDDESLTARLVAIASRIKNSPLWEHITPTLSDRQMKALGTYIPG